MITRAFEDFIRHVMANAAIARVDVRRLQRDIFPNGVTTQDEADILIALDRAVVEKDCAWSAFVVRTVVDFVVWTSRPTGRVDGETAEWLIGSLGCGKGPTPVAMAIAFEVVREAEAADERLLAFVMRSTSGRRHLAELPLALDLGA